MGCVGKGLRCTERQVSICAKDSGGPYSYDVTGGLIAAAKAEGADYAVDIYPHYGSDVEATLRAGYDIRHGLIVQVFMLPTVMREAILTVFTIYCLF